MSRRQTVVTKVEKESHTESEINEYIDELIEQGLKELPIDLIEEFCTCVNDPPDERMNRIFDYLNIPEDSSVRRNIMQQIFDYQSAHPPEPKQEPEPEQQKSVKDDPEQDEETAEIKKHIFESIQCVSDVEAKQAEFLIPMYVPKRTITIMAGDGGSGKTFAWVAMIASLSAGRSPDFMQVNPPEWKIKPSKILFLSGEDSVSYTLRKRLEDNGANLKNIFFVSATDENFQDIYFDDYNRNLEVLIATVKPDVVVFDPLQNFIPPDVNMGSRNAMRQTLLPLLEYGEKYNVTFIIVAHSNKRQNAAGRDRVADSADIWDMARSVLIVGSTGEGKTKYLSHEKSNYCEQQETILFEIKNNKVVFCGKTDKRDADFQRAKSQSVKASPARDEAKQFIVDTLKSAKEKPLKVRELEDMCVSAGISKATIRRAKEELKKDNIIKIWSLGYGNNKEFLISMK